MNIAFLIEAHDDGSQLSRLVHRLHGNGVFVHIDAKSPLATTWSSGQAVIVPSVRVHWAGFSQVVATLRLLRSAVHAPERYEKFVLLSGACYPIGSLDRLRSRLADRTDASYVKYVRVDESAHLQTLSDRYYARDDVLPSRVRAALGDPPMLTRVARKARESLDIRRKPRPPWVRAHGSSWWAISRPHAEYIINFVDDPANESFVRYYQTSFASDEQFFHTILANSPFASAAQEIPFEGRGTYRCANLHLIDPTLSKWFDESDFERVTESGQYFVRKVRSGLSDGLLDRLDSLE